MLLQKDIIPTAAATFVDGKFKVVRKQDAFASQ